MEFKIYVDRLREGQQESFEGDALSSVFFTEEKDLIFNEHIHCKGEAYIAGDHLVLKLDVKTTVKIPCTICNEWTEIPLTISNFTHTEPLEEISSGIFDFSEMIRTDLLLALPQFAECRGNCPERESVKNFIRSPSDLPEGAHFPFSGL